MSHSRNNFTNAIAGYLEQHGNRVNMYSLATRHTYTLVVGNSNVKRSELSYDQLELVSMVEDLAASYIALEDVHPVEAVELAYQEITARDIVALSVSFKHHCGNNLSEKRRAILELFSITPSDQEGLVNIVVDMAASYVALEGVQPVEAVEMAYREIVTEGVLALGVLYNARTLARCDSNLIKHQAVSELPCNDNWLYHDDEDAWLHYSYS